MSRLDLGGFSVSFSPDNHNGASFVELNIVGANGRFRFRPDMVKLDGALVGEWFRSRDASRIEGVQALADALSIALGAEHIESREMSDFARSQGIPYAQGFHIAEPRRYRRGGTLAA